ncbi:MAG: FixH family protein [Bacteriovoracaceae bacterium]
MKIFLVSLVLVFSHFLYASEAEVFCTSSNSICAQVQPEKPFTSNGENKFVLTITSSKSDLVELTKLDLWMDMGGHGHSSSPVKITKIQDNVYAVSKAFFVMQGSWLIRLKVSQNAVIESITIPVEIDN